MSITHCVKGHGPAIGVTSSAGFLGMLENRWHLSHLWARRAASFCMEG